MEKEENEKVSFVPIKKFLKIGKIKIDYTRIASGRVLEAQDLYNKKVVYTKYKTHVESMKAIIEVLLVLIKIDFSFLHLFDFLKRQLITEKYILKNVTFEELSLFVEEALEPIIGTKKKELNKKKDLLEIGTRIAKNLTTEQLLKLFPN